MLRVRAVTPEHVLCRRPSRRAQSMPSGEGLHAPRIGSACPRNQGLHPRYFLLARPALRT